MYVHEHFSGYLAKSSEWYSGTYNIQLQYTDLHTNEELYATLIMFYATQLWNELRWIWWGGEEEKMFLIIDVSSGSKQQRHR